MLGKVFIDYSCRSLRILDQTSDTLSNWLIPYKLEWGKRSFQCETREFKPKARLGNQAKNAKAKGKNS